MTDLKSVGIKELKNNLSAYLRDVRRGARVLVSDRGRVVAELHEPTPGYASETPMDPKLAEWIDAGVLRMPIVPRSKLPPSPVRLEEGMAARLLDADRGEPER